MSVRYSFRKSLTIVCVLALCLVACKAKQSTTTATKTITTKNTVYFESIDAAKSHYKRGGDVNYAEPKYGWTAIILASHEGKYELAKYLILKGADVNKVSTDEEVSPLNRAAAEGHLKLVKLLIQHGADVNHQDKMGTTPLMRAAFSGFTLIMQELIANKALIDARANRGESAIFLAVAKEQIEAVKLLLAHDANIERPTVFEKTPLSRAKKLNNTILIKLLSSKLKK